MATSDRSEHSSNPSSAIHTETSLTLNAPLEMLSPGFFSILPLPSSVSDLLGTDEAPLSTEMLESRRLQAELVLSLFDQHFDKIQAIFNAKREEIVSSIQSYRIVLHPISRNPPEILLKNFSYCAETVKLASPNECRKLDSLDTTRGVWCQPSVPKCSKLWSSLSIDIDALSRHVNEQANPVMAQKIEANGIDILSHYLYRSKACPLTIAVFSSAKTHALIPMMYVHSFRWSSVLLSLHPESFQSLSSMKGYLPQLKVLHIWSPVTSPTAIWSSLPAIDAFEYAPSLTTFIAYGIPNITTTVALPWSQLTTLRNGTLLYSSAGTGESDNFGEILTKAGSLGESKYLLISRNMVRIAPIMPVVMPVVHDRLHTLSMQIMRQKFGSSNSASGSRHITRH
ncbi:hypothetical protein D9757_007418 [Collybiopsis confluens]|uniref:Uncharacterized protein n=1 Tax=Collybiopsis confluens TaxID=2823264 RepID=A0A8H5HIE5_9AGAR|nr:hypothetical protein D9757_007418 [Collybiopsis confluens]